MHHNKTFKVFGQRYPIFGSARTSCTTNPMAQWNPIDAPLTPREPVGLPLDPPRPCTPTPWPPWTLLAYPLTTLYAKLLGLGKLLGCPWKLWGITVQTSYWEGWQHQYLVRSPQSKNFHVEKFWRRSDLPTSFSLISLSVCKKKFRAHVH